MKIRKVFYRVLSLLLVVVLFSAMSVNVLAVSPCSNGTYSGKYLGGMCTITLFSYKFYHSSCSLNITINKNTGNAGEIEVFVIDPNGDELDRKCIHGTGTVGFLTDEAGTYTVKIVNKTYTNTYISGAYTYYDY